MEKPETPFEAWRGHGSPTRGADKPDGESVTGNREASWRALADEHVRSTKPGEGVRAYMGLGRQRLLEAHRSGASGTEVVRAHGEMIDGLLRHLFEMAGNDSRARRPAPKGRCAVVAQGGYGSEVRHLRP